MKRYSLLFLLLLLFPFARVNSAPEVKEETVQLLVSKLNSDRIAYFFGSYGVEPIHIPVSPFGESRISNLYSIHGDEKIMRTLAVVEFQQPVPEILHEVHQDIAQGKSIGIALRDQGWKIDKIPLYFGSVALSQQLKVWMHERACNQAAVHIYKLNVFRENAEERLTYCTIIEVHSPQYLDENWLRAFYQDQYEPCRKSSDKVDVLIDSLHSLIHAMPLPNNYRM